MASRSSGWKTLGRGSRIGHGRGAAAAAAVVVVGLVKGRDLSDRFVRGCWWD